MSFWGPRRTVAMAMSIGIVSMLAVPTVSALPVAVVAHEACSLILESTVSAWTPMAIVNSPYGGGAVGVVTLASDGGSESFAVNATDGESVGLFSLDRWSVYGYSPSWIWGPGMNVPCTGGPIAVDTTRADGVIVGLDVASERLLPTGSMSDAALPDQLTFQAETGSSAGTAVASVIFDAAFRGGVASTLATCPGPASSPSALQSVTLQTVEVSVPTTLAGHPELVPSAAPVSATISYYLEGSFTGRLQLQQSAAGGDAFAWTPC